MPDDGKTAPKTPVPKSPDMPAIAFFPIFSPFGRRIFQKPLLPLSPFWSALSRSEPYPKKEDSKSEDPPKRKQVKAFEE
jgi:hypothetical protein